MIGKYLNHSLSKIGKVGIKSIAEVKNLGGNIVSLFPEGGTVLELNGYRIHTFTKDGILDIPRAITVEYLIVAAGGRGGNGYYTANAPECYSGSGGGAGGVRQGTTGLPGGASIAITVGQTSGANSSMGTISATGGGNGSFLHDGGAGGSGAGGSSHYGTQCYGGAGNKGGYSPAEGYKGGNGSMDNPGGGNGRASGGGGGAGGAGTDASYAGPGVGGAGITSSISGTSKTYATGGSGNRRTNGNGANGSPNTGDGGQGGGGINGGFTGGEGGSGIVIIRYPL